LHAWDCIDFLYVPILTTLELAEDAFTSSHDRM